MDKAIQLLFPILLFQSNYLKKRLARLNNKSIPEFRKCLTEDALKYGLSAAQFDFVCERFVTAATHFSIANVLFATGKLKCQIDIPHTKRHLAATSCLVEAAMETGGLSRGDGEATLRTLALLMKVDLEISNQFSCYTRHGQFSDRLLHSAYFDIIELFRSHLGSSCQITKIYALVCDLHNVLHPDNSLKVDTIKIYYRRLSSNLANK